MRTALLVGRRSYVPVLPETDTRSCLKLAWSPTGHSRRKVTLWHGFSNAAERGWAGSVAAVAVAEVVQRADPAVLWLEAPLVLLEPRLLEPRLRRCSPGRRVSLDAGDDRVVMVRRRTPVVGCGDADSICRREREPWVRRPGGPNWHASVGSIHGSSVVGGRVHGSSAGPGRAGDIGKCVNRMVGTTSPIARPEASCSEAPSDPGTPGSGWLSEAAKS